MVIEIKRNEPQKTLKAKEPNVMIDLQIPEEGKVGFRIVGTLSHDGTHEIKSISYTAPPKDRAEYMRDYQREYMYDRRRAKKEGMTVKQWRDRNAKS